MANEDFLAVSQAQMEQLRQSGFIELENAISPQQSHQFACTVADLILTQKCPGISPFNPRTLEYPQLVDRVLDCLMTLERTDHKYIQNVYDSLKQSPALLQIVTQPRLVGAVNSMLGRPVDAALFVRQTSCRIDIPHDTAFTLDWHQEVHYAFKDAELIQLWAPVIADITEQNGAMRVLPGSHAVGVAATNDFVPEFGVRQFTVVPEVVAKFKEKIVTMRRGNALLFTSTLIHKSGRNTSTQPRLTLLTHYYHPSGPDFYKNLKQETKAANPYGEKK